MTLFNDFFFLYFFSHIAIVPPTPPPHLDNNVTSRSGVKYRCVSSPSLVQKIINISDSSVIIFTPFLFFLQSIKNSRAFAKSLEDLVTSFTSHIVKNKSKLSLSHQLRGEQKRTLHLLICAWLLQMHTAHDHRGSLTR